MECLKDHKIVLNMINKALKTPGWPDNDAADPQPLSMSCEMETSLRTGTKRLRSAAKENGVFGPLPAGKWSGSA